MKSIQGRLMVVFVPLLGVAVLTAGIGYWLVDTTHDVLRRDRETFNQTNALLQKTGDSVRDYNALLGTLDETMSGTAGRFGAATETMRHIAEITLPRLLTVDRLRTAIGRITSAERTLLLTLTMRNLSVDSLRGIRDAQRAAITAAFAEIEAAKRTYEVDLVCAEHYSEGDENAAWEPFVRAYEAWHANHGKFMGHIGEIEGLIAQMIRMGPKFTTLAGEAYDTVFITGRETVEHCEKTLDILVAQISKTVTDTVSEAHAWQTSAAEDIARESRSVGAMREQAAPLVSEVAEAQTTIANAITAADGELARARNRLTWLLGAAVAAILFGLGVSVYSARRISRPIRDLAAHIARVSRGDLTRDVPAVQRGRADELGHLARATQGLIDASRSEIDVAEAVAAGDFTIEPEMRSSEDQLGRALLGMVRTTNSALLHVNRAVDGVTHGAGEVSAASQSLSQGAVESASALEEISTSVTHVGDQTRENADNATAANRLARDSRDAANRGYQAVTELVAAMEAIETSGQQIATVAKLIDNIAFQTNLLALNAAVEAARAGRNGKGFSVVADEVRSLAGRSAKAARETTDMIEAMTTRVGEGIQFARKTDVEFKEIVSATTQVATLFDQIALASNEQSTAVNQIADGLRQIDHVIQQNSLDATQTARSAEILSRQAAALSNLVDGFRLNDAEESGGDEDPSAPYIPSAAASRPRMLQAPSSPPTRT